MALLKLCGLHSIFYHGFNVVKNFTRVEGKAMNVHYKPLLVMIAYKAAGAYIKDYPNVYYVLIRQVRCFLWGR